MDLIDEPNRIKGEWRGGDDARSRMLNRSRQRRRSRLKEEKDTLRFQCRHSEYRGAVRYRIRRLF